METWSGGDGALELGTQEKDSYASDAEIRWEGDRGPRFGVGYM